jgi:outer membrane protein assembly factor BamB
MKTFGLLFLLAGVAAFCQDAQPDRATVPFSDPSRPKSLHASLINGGITVKGYDGKDAIVEARPQGDSGRRGRRAERSDGMRRIDIGGSGLVVDESDNVITVGTSLKLHAVNGGDIVVDHIVGDVEINNTNGNATATHISGAAVVHALNGKVLVSLDKVTADKPMSFSSLNGDIDVTLPADVKARAKLKTDNGAVYSDFEVAVDSSSRQPVVQDSKSGKGRYRVQFDRAMYALINGGGPEIQFTTFNGNIYLRKTK